MISLYLFTFIYSVMSLGLLEVSVFSKTVNTLKKYSLLKTEKIFYLYIFAAEPVIKVIYNEEKRCYKFSNYAVDLQCKLLFS